MCNLIHNWTGIVKGGQYHSTRNTNHAGGWHVTSSRLLFEPYALLVSAVVACDVEKKKKKKFFSRFVPQWTLGERCQKTQD